MKPSDIKNMSSLSKFWRHNWDGDAIYTVTPRHVNLSISAVCAPKIAALLMQCVAQGKDDYLDGMELSEQETIGVITRADGLSFPAAREFRDVFANVVSGKYVQNSKLFLLPVNFVFQGAEKASQCFHSLGSSDSFGDGPSLAEMVEVLPGLDSWNQLNFEFFAPHVGGMQ